ncbi:hypothetical protein [Streptococcus ruminantium]|uniref:hypothetical protein n=1 Tax=Streptococcus ruminantium TaxID=1917441 RepID=UPI0012DD6D0C|nr:hypothetical protein [Streptococcus ruminantium]
MIETRYIFLDDETQASGYSIYDIAVTNDDIEVVKQQIQNFWNSIRNGEFGCGCTKEGCDFCRLASFVNFELF